MPSLIIHLAIAKRYMKLHPNEISNPNNFKKGSIAPDLNSNFSKILSKPEKVTTHYYLNPSAKFTFTSRPRILYAFF